MRVPRTSTSFFWRSRRTPTSPPAPRAKAAIAVDGSIWLVHPKGSKTLREGAVRAAGRAAGLVDVKVVAFSATHTADDFTVPFAKRSSR